MKKYILVLATLMCLACREVPDATKSEFTAAEQSDAAERLVERVVGKKAARAFSIVITPSTDGDWFAYSSDGRKIVLEGNNGVSVASALRQYLSDYCSWQRSWCGSSENLPDPLPLPESRVKKESPYKWRYYLNY